MSIAPESASASASNSVSIAAAAVALPPALHAALQAGQPVFWGNPRWQADADGVTFEGAALERAAMHAAHQRLQRWAPQLAQLFPELQATQGQIAAPLRAAPAMAAYLQLPPGPLWL